MGPTPSLGTTGNHPSVFKIGDNDSKSGIMNSCLAFIHCHMSSRDKVYIKGKVTSTFSLEQLKDAREQLFKYSDPSKEYAYRGPNGKNERSKINDAFDGIYSKMVKLDAENNMPILSVPSCDLLTLLTIHGKEHTEHTECDKKFAEIDKEMGELKKTFHSFVSVVTSSNQQSQSLVSAIPPAVRNRLLSTGSKRSASEMSDDDEAESHIDSESNDPPVGFTYPRKQRQKVKRSKISSPPPPASYSNAVQRKNKEKTPTWGKVKATTSFRGAVPDVFLYNCDFEVTEGDITEWCQLNNIVFRKIEKKSHQLARRTSFLLSVTTQESYDMIMEGSILPEGIAARKFIPPKWKPEDKGKITGNQFRAAISSAEVQKYLQEMDAITGAKDGAPNIGMDVTDTNASISA